MANWSVCCGGKVGHDGREDARQDCEAAAEPAGEEPSTKMSGTLTFGFGLFPLALASEVLAGAVLLAEVPAFREILLS